MIRTKPISLPMRMRGAALFVGLIMLLLLTMLGITAMQVTTLQERMAGNFLVEHRAFETVEGCLAKGQASVRDVTTALDLYPTVANLTLGMPNPMTWDSWLSGTQSTARTSILRRYCGPGCSDTAGVPSSTDPERLVNFYILTNLDSDSDSSSDCKSSFNSKATSMAVAQSVYVY